VFSRRPDRISWHDRHLVHCEEGWPRLRVSATGDSGQGRHLQGLILLVFLALPVLVFQIAIPPLTAAAGQQPTMTAGPQPIAQNVSIGYPIALNDQKKLFFDTASNLWWAFYSNGSSMLCTTSPDGAAWAPAVVMNSSVVAGSKFSLWHDDALSLLYYVSTSGGNTFHYRYGNIGTSGGCGGISWSITNTEVPGAMGNLNTPTISAVDPSTIWISVTENSKTNYFIQVFLCDAARCTSSHNVTLPNTTYESIILGTGSVSTGSSEAVLLYAADSGSGGSPIAFDCTTDGGTHWMNSSSATVNGYGGNRMSAYMTGSTVYVAAIEAPPPNNVFYFTYTLGGTLSAETQLVPAGGGIRNVDIASDGSSGLLVGYTDSVNVGYLYSQNLGRNWGGIKYLVLNGPIVYQSVLNLEKGPDSTYGMMWSQGNFTHDIEFVQFVPSTPDPTATLVKCSPTSFVVGVSTTCTASVSDPGNSANVPTGNVSFSADVSGSGSFASSTCDLLVSGSTASCAVFLTAGSGGEGAITVVGTYSGDSTHGGSNGVATVTATKRTTSISVSCTPLSVPVTGRTTCTATVKDTSPGDKIALSGGNVTFGASPSGSGAFSPASAHCTPSFGTCSVTFTPGTGSMGTITMTGSYAGDADHSSSSTASGFDLTATGVSTVTGITCFPSPDQINQGSVCTATVSDSGGATETPTGTVTFGTNSSAGGSFSPSSSCSLSGGLCSATYTPTMTGVITIHGSYGGDRDHTGSVGNFTFAVTSRNSSVSVSCASSTLHVTGSTTCTATVTDFSIGVGITPTGGTITFTASPGGSGTFTPASGQCTLNSGTCTVTFSPIETGNISIAASYAGDANHLPSSTSAGFGLNATPLVATRTLVTCSPSFVQVNQGSVCTATVSDSGGATETPTGTVTFGTNSSAGGSFSPSSSCSLSGGSCSVIYTPSVTGPVAIQGVYVGDPDHTGSNGTSSIAATTRYSAVSVSCTSSSLLVTGSATCTANVTDASLGAKVVPSGGNVTFAVSPPDSGTFTPASAQCTLDFGTCSVTFSPSKIGNITISASYAGDENHSLSSSVASFAISATESTPSYVLLLLALDIISAAVAFPISYFSFKFNRLVGSPALKAISIGFALLGTGLLVEGLTTFITDATVVNGLLAKSLVADAGLLFLALQLLAYFIFAWGYAIEIFGSSKAPFDKLTEPGTLLPVGILASTFGAYYDITLLAYLLMVALLAFIVFEAVLVFSRSRRKSALLVLLGFGVIFGSHVLMLDSVAALTQVTFYEGTFGQFIGFAMLLWFLVRSGRFGSS